MSTSFLHFDTEALSVPVYFAATSMDPLSCSLVNCFKALLSL
jgi:hypothetical protein